MRLKCKSEEVIGILNLLENGQIAYSELVHTFVKEDQTLINAEKAIEKKFLSFLDNVENPEKEHFLDVLATKTKLPSFYLAEKFLLSRLNERQFCRLYRISATRFRISKELIKIVPYYRQREAEINKKRYEESQNVLHIRAKARRYR